MGELSRQELLGDKGGGWGAVILGELSLNLFSNEDTPSHIRSEFWVSSSTQRLLFRVSYFFKAATFSDQNFYRVAA